VIWLENNILEYNYDNGSPVNGRQLAVSWMDAAGVSDFAFSENQGVNWVSGLGFNTLNTFTLSNYKYPSVAIGGAYNVVPGTSSDYYIGVLYQATDNNGDVGIYVDVWFIQNPDPAGTTGGTYTAMSTVQLVGKMAGIPHWDIVTDDPASGPLLTDHLVVAWEDYNYLTTPSNVPGGTVFYSTLSNMAAGSGAPTQIINDYTYITNAPFTNIGAKDVDICAMYVGSTHIAFTASRSDGRLHWGRWDVASSMMVTPVYIDGLSCAPRIDAVDPYSSNLLTNHYMDVVYCYEQLIKSWPTMAPCTPFVVNPITILLIPSTGFRPDGNPVVACNKEGNYGVAYPAVDANNKDILHQDLTYGNFGCGQLVGPNFWEIDNHGSDSGYSTGPVALSNTWQGDYSSGTNPAYEFSCWFKPVVPSSTPEIAFKIENNAFPHLYKQSGNNSNGNISSEAAEMSGIKISPNPVTVNITVEGLSGKQYNVTDITGRIVCSGELKSGKEKIDMAKLIPGIYILDIEGYERRKFVKE
jgi:hypothetical protein